MKNISKNLYWIEPSERYPKGAIRVIVSIWRGGKREKTLSVADYAGSRRACTEAAEALRARFRHELRAAATKRTAGIDSQSMHPIRTLGDVARERVRLYGSGGNGCYYDAIISDCGAAMPDQWRDTYVMYLRKLAHEPATDHGKPINRTASTLNHYRQVFRTIFNFAIAEGIIDRVPVKIEMESSPGRDRVWTIDERNKIFQAIEDLNSWIYWPVYFAERNPIRAGDLFSLTRENYNRDKNWIEFYPSKTRERQNRKTYLKQIDQSLRDYIDSLPADCPYLFPAINAEGKAYHAHSGRNFQYHKEWRRVCVKAGISELHFHDLKHIAITYLLDSGYSELDLKNCGIQYSSEMVSRYYHHDAEKAPVISGYEKPALFVRSEAV